MAQRLTVQIPDELDRQYPIIIERGLLKNLGQRVAEFGLDGHVSVLTNTTVAQLYGQELLSQLSNAHLATMQDGEQYKNLGAVRHFYDEMLANGADRGTTVLALGGGVVGDTAGFVAASYMRGVRLVQMPTTLLSMVDSSVGGKVGVDMPQGKNLVGAFKQPEMVLIDPDVLDSLPPEQWRAGMAEVIKHGFLADERLLNPALFAPKHAAELVARAVQVKIDVVQQDPFEKGIRMHLNLGHTFGHAIEQLTQYAWLHGDAVGVGLLAAAKLSHELGLCSADLVAQVDTILAEIGLPRSIGMLDPEAIYDAMATDKKWKNGVSRFILLHGMNQPTIVHGIERARVVDVLQSLRKL